MRKLFWFALCFSGAVFAVRYGLPFWSLLPLFGVVIFRENRRARFLLAACGIALGLLWCRGYDALFFAPARALDGKTVRLEATVTDWPAPTQYGVQLPVRVRAEQGGEVKALLYADASYGALTPGDALSFVAACRLSDQIHGRETDIYTSSGTFLLASAYGEIAVSSPARVPVRFWPQMAARTLKDCISRIFPADTAPLMTALLTGDKSLLPDAFDAALKRTGLSHAVAVSGMHVSFLITLITLLAGRRKQASALAGILLLVFFAAMVGNTPGVLRAVFLQSTLLLAPLLGREADPPTSLATGLMLLLLQNPYAAASVSLQLSFAAVAGMYLLSAPLYARWIKNLPAKGVSGHMGRWLFGGLSASLGAIAFTTPLAAYYFGAVSLIAPLTNFLALWAVSAAFLSGAAASALGMLLPAAGALLAQLVALPLRYLLLLVPACAQIPFAAVSLGSSYYGFWLFFCYCVLLLSLLFPLLWRGEKTRWLFPAAACALTLCCSVLMTGFTVRTGPLTVSALDVGQGQSIVLHSGGRTALVDCGGSVFHRAGNIAADYLQNLGPGGLDYLILTHYHSDHANGVLQLMERVKVKTLLLPDTDPDALLRLAILDRAEETGTEVRFITEDESLPFGAAGLTLFAPLGDGGANEEGLSVLCTAGSFDVLITGDMPGAVEAILIARAQLPDIELLIVGHHGSKYSTSPALLDAVTPEAAVISVGYNTYGHPTEEALTRLSRAGIVIYRTDLMGTITVHAN